MSENDDGQLDKKISAISLAAQIAESKLQDTDEQISKLELRIKKLEAGYRNEYNGEHAGVLQHRNEVVVLIHGIRDRALWQSEVRASLRSAGFDVALTNYDRLDLLRFWFPFPIFRNAVLRSIRDQIRSIRLQDPNRDISVIAHSFGTYIMARVMSEEFDIVFKRVIFCGGVYSSKIKFEQFSNRFSPPILNEIGAKDYWPALANSFTWGYGSPGTFGFRRPLFEDRWHKNAGHCYFLTKEFCSQYWIPFLINGHIKDGEESPDKPLWIIRVVGFLHIKYIFILFILLILAHHFFM